MWKYATGAGSAVSVGKGELDMTLGWSGNASWHAQVDYKDIQSCKAELQRGVTIPTPDVYVRMYVYMKKPAPTASITSFEMSMLSKLQGYAAIGPTIDHGALGVEGYGDTHVSTMKEGGTFPTDTWVCVEYQLHQDTKGSFTAWRDGVQAFTTPVTLDATSEPLDGIFIGIYGYVNMGLVDIWYDDVAMSATRIGCEAK